jgi:hypothetical protein
MNAAHVRNVCLWQELHRVRVQRWAEDTKAESRCDARKKRQFQASRNRACEKHARRMDSWCKEVSSHLARFALRNHVGLVVYQDNDRGFAPGFPWFKLKACLANALAGYNIRLESEGEKKSPGEDTELCNV